MSSVFKQQLFGLLNNLHFWVGQECPGSQSKGLEQGSGCLNLMPMLSAVIPSFEEKKKNCFAVRPAFFFLSEQDNDYYYPSHVVGLNLYFTIQT